jgi:hypothetical protein
MSIMHKALELTNQNWTSTKSYCDKECKCVSVGTMEGSDCCCQLVRVPLAHLLFEEEDDPGLQRVPSPMAFTAAQGLQMEKGELQE